MMNQGGQTVMDRLNAVRFGLAGQGLAKSVCKATTEEPIGPKKKHLDYLLHCTEEPNVSVPQLANTLIERCQNSNWVVVFKSLTTIHHLMLYGNERFLQYFASANVSLADVVNQPRPGQVQGYGETRYTRRYANYLNQKALSYRACAFDFCRAKRGRDEGILRKMNADLLLKSLPVVQKQIDSLLEFEISTQECANPVLSSCFLLLFRDLIRLFACYNDGIINLLEKFFTMNKKQARDGFEIYKRFLKRMDQVTEFLKLAENVGVPRGEIPDLTKAPASLLAALEGHLEVVEGKKAQSPTMTTSMSIHAGITNLSQTENSLDDVNEIERRRVLEEEEEALRRMKEKHEAEKARRSSYENSPTKTPQSSSTNNFSENISPKKAPENALDSLDPFGMFTSIPSNKSNSQAQQKKNNLNDFDLLGSLDSHTQNGGSSNSSGMPAPTTTSQSNNMWDPFGDSPAAAPQQSPKTSPQKNVTKNLDESLMNIVGNLNLNPGQTNAGNLGSPQGTPIGQQQQRGFTTPPQQQQQSFDPFS